MTDRIASRSNQRTLVGRAAHISGNAITLCDRADASKFRAFDRILFSPDKITDDTAAARAAGAFRSGAAVVNIIDVETGVVYCESNVQYAVIAACDNDYVYLAARSEPAVAPPETTRHGLEQPALRAGMSPEDLDAIYRDTSPAIAQFHARTGITIRYRVFEEPEDEHGPAQWVVEIRLGSPATHIEIIDVDSWRALRAETGELWREFVLDCCEGGRRAMAARARRR